MAKNKAELQSDANAYRRALREMRKAHNDGRFLDAIKEAIDSCEYIDGMMQYEKRFKKKELQNVETIKYVFQYGPLVFDRPNLEKIRDVLKSQKRIEKTATADLRVELERAVELMWDARRLWHLLEQSTELSQENVFSLLGGKRERWRAIIEKWSQMGLVVRVSHEATYRLSLATRITNQARGKCPECGAIGKATMGTFLYTLACPKYNSAVLFVILPAAPAMK